MKPESLSLYHFEGCPYCSRVRSALARLDVDLELRDIHQDPARAAELQSATGRTTVPCLRIEEASGEARWMHESADIIAFLDRQYG